MTDQPAATPKGVNLTPQFLRQEAERSFRIAENTFDTAIHDALMDYGQELLERAQKMESAMGTAETLAQTKTSDLSNGLE